MDDLNNDYQTFSIGDIVIIDDVHLGVVEDIFLAFSREAREYGCYESGGLMINTSNYGLILHTAGVGQEVRKIDRKIEGMDIPKPSLPKGLPKSEEP